MTFGERLREIREERGMAVGALAQAVGVTEGAIRQMESGQTKSATFVTGLRLARVLAVSPEQLAGLPERRPDFVLTLPDGAVATVEITQPGNTTAAEVEMTIATALAGIGTLAFATPPAGDAETEPLARQVAAAVARALQPLEERLERLEAQQDPTALAERAL